MASKFHSAKFNEHKLPPAKIPLKSNTTNAPSHPAPPSVPYIEPSSYVDAVQMQDIKPYLYFAGIILGAWILIRIANRS